MNPSRGHTYIKKEPEVIDTPINHTLADLLEVYRVKVSDLEQRLESSERHREESGYTLIRVRKERDRALEDADRNRKLIQERAEKNVELAAKVKKLEGVIESLHIELQTEREAHQATKENQA